MSFNQQFVPQVTVFHFPTYRRGSSVPQPLDTSEFAWETASERTLFTALKSTKYDAGTSTYQGKLELFWTPICQQSHWLLKPVDALWYWLVVVSVLMDYFRQNTWSSLVLHLHAADKIAWPLGFARNYFLPKNALWYTEHWAIYGNDLPDNYGNRSIFFRWYMKRIWKQTDVSAAISVFTHQQLQHTYRIPRRMFLFRNPVNTEIFKFNPTAGFENTRDTKVRWLHVSNLEERKQVPSIIRSFFEVVNLRPEISMELAIAGGDFQDFTSRNSDFNGVNLMDNPSLKFLGKLSPSELAKEMYSSSVLVLFSTAENVPCVVAEAQCCGLPIISSAIAGIPEMVFPERVWFAKGLSEMDLVNAMLSFLDDVKTPVRNNSSEISVRANPFLDPETAVNAKNRFDPDHIGREILFAYQRYTP